MLYILGLYECSDSEAPLPKILQVKERAMELAKAMESEDGVTGAVKAFFKHFPKKTSNEEEPQSPPKFLGSVRKCLGCS